MNMENRKATIAKKTCIFTGFLILSCLLLLDWSFYCEEIRYLVSHIPEIIPDLQSGDDFSLTMAAKTFIYLWVFPYCIGVVILVAGLLFQKEHIIPIAPFFFLLGPLFRFVFGKLAEFDIFDYFIPLDLPLFSIALTLCICRFPEKAKSVWFFPSLMTALSNLYDFMSEHPYMRMELWPTAPIDSAINLLFRVSECFLLGAMCYYCTATAKSLPIVVDSKSQPAIARLKTLKKMLDNGLITQEEFNAKKNEILGL